MPRPRDVGRGCYCDPGIVPAKRCLITRSCGLILRLVGSTGVTTFPGAGLPMSMRSAVTSSPVSRLKLAHGLGMRPKVIFWIGRPVTVFMIVAVAAARPTTSVMSTRRLGISHTICALCSSKRIGSGNRKQSRARGRPASLAMTKAGANGPFPQVWQDVAKPADLLRTVGHPTKRSSSTD